MPAPAAPPPRYPTITVPMVGQDGNAYAIIARVSRALRSARVPAEQIAEFQRECHAGDYDALLRTVMRWVDVE